MIHMFLFSSGVVSDSLLPHELQWTPSLLVLYYFPPTHVLESVMPSNHLILCRPPSPPAYNPSQHLGLFQWVGPSHQEAKLLELQLQHQSYQWVFRVNFLQGCLVWSPLYPKDSQESSPAPQIKNHNSSALSLLYSPTLTHTWLLGKLLLWQ